MVLNKLSNLIPAKSSPPSHTSSWNGATDQEPQRVNLLPLPAKCFTKIHNTLGNDTQTCTPPAMCLSSPV